MIEFDRNYFQGEIRSGYYVDSERKRLWAANLEVLMEIDRICKKHSITYFLAYGTMLGAVRHNGYVPWDDDMDIIMLRRDYMKFLSVLETDLLFPFVSMDIYHDETWDITHSRVVNGRYGINTEPWYLERFHGYPYSAGVDIFHFDNQWKNEADYYWIAQQAHKMGELKKLITKWEKMQEDHADRDEIEKTGAEIENGLAEAERICGVRIDREKNIVNQLLRMEDGMYAWCGDEDSEELIVWSVIGDREYHTAGYRREWYRESIELPFEGIMLPVPAGFHGALVRIYGLDYRSPKKYNHHLDDRNRKMIQEIKNETDIFKGKLDHLEKLLEGREKV